MSTLDKKERVPISLRFFNKLVCFAGKKNFSFDKDIPIGTILSILVLKSLSLIRGIIKLRRIKKVFVGTSSTIKCVGKIKFKGLLSIDKMCHIDALSREGIVFGNNVSIGKFTTIECTGNLKYLGKGMIVGDNVGLGTHGFFGAAGGISIGDDTIIGNYVSFHSENHNYTNPIIPIRLQGVNHKGIEIGCNCWIGAKATILDGTVIGDGCIVAAGAVVTGQFPDNVIIGGVPAKIIKSRI